jgi:hypothetical protein
MKTEKNGTSLFKKLGSETFLDPKSLLIWLAPLMVILSIGNSRSQNIEQVLIWLLANIASLGVIALIVLPLRFFTYSKNPELVLNIFMVILISAFFGAVKTFTTLGFADWLLDSGRDASSLWVGVLRGTIIGVTVLPLISFLGLVIKKLEYERQLLLAAKSVEHRIALSNSERESLGDLEATLSRLSGELTENNASGYLSSFHAKLLRELVERNVRPLSTSLYRALEQKYPVVAPGELIIQALRTSPPFFAVALFYLGTAGENMTSLGIGLGSVATLLGCLLIYVGLRFSFEFLKLVNLVRPAFFLATTFIIPALAATVLNLIFQGDAPTQWALFLITGAWFTQISLLSTCVKVALSSAAKVRVEAELNGFSEDYSALELRRRTVANQLHGEVQSRLMSLVLQEQGGQKISAAVAINELNSLIHFSNTQQEINLDTFEKMMKELASRWQRFAEVTYDIPQPLPKDLDANRLYLLIEEAISNSFRHGLANQVSVELMTGPKTVLKVIDNGLGPVTGKPGLGSKVLDATSKSWKLKAGESGGSELTVTLS